ncbi:hypothetical protein DBY73_008870 [Enterobacter sp. RIT418]|nr:hypothetical protein DBY73_008870 [Enterobacter sp. RIT 418]
MMIGATGDFFSCFWWGEKGERCVRSNRVASKKAKGPEISLQPLLYLVAPAGLEPATKRL